MNKKDYVAYAAFSMVAMCCFFAAKVALGFWGSVFGLSLGTVIGFAAMRLVSQHTLRYGVYALGIITILGLTFLYGAVRLSAPAVTIANLKGQWEADDHGRPISLEIGDSTAVLDMMMLNEPLRLGLVLKQDSLLMTTPEKIKLAWRIRSLSQTNMNVEDEDIEIGFQRVQD